ncbi:MAG TPA: diguanylate cyclase, partial [Solirubrobacteraceae bacterium]|nr:diguanylate cyclase [Solirubrobacteraceae bacterium]
MSERRIAAPPRAVGDAPISGLLERGEELAKEWALALIAARELGRAPELSLEAFAREGPGLCELLLGALASDAELERLGEWAGGISPLVGSEDPLEWMGAVEALRGVLWRALLEELRDASVARIGELADRLARACAVLAGRALAGAGVPRWSPAEPISPLEPPAPISPFGPPEPGWVSEIDIRDARAPAGDAPWVASIERRLARRIDDGLPFAVLLMEVAEIERIGHSESPRALEGLVLRVEEALSEELRPADVLTREAPGRYWLVTPGTDGTGARALAERLSEMVGLAVSHRGVPLGLAIGLASCPRDGEEAAELAMHAEVGLYEARASGRAIGHAPRGGE